MSSGDLGDYFEEIEFLKRAVAFFGSAETDENDADEGGDR
jgi:hypothetical protein